MHDAEIRFYRAIPAARSPLAADKSAQGALLTKAYRYCEPVRAASGWGWYLFPPCDLRVVWSGTAEIRWWWNGQAVGRLDGLAVEAGQYPDFPVLFDQHAPPECQGHPWPLLSALQEPGMIQVWTGWLAQTAPDWSLELRAVVNRPRPPGYDLVEGIIETDRWFGGVFANLQLTRTHQPVHLWRRVPLVQVRPLPRAVYQAKNLGVEIPLDAWTAEDWARYHDTAVKPQPLGHYAVTSRQRPAACLRRA